MSNNKTKTIFATIEDPEAKLKAIQEQCVKSEVRNVPYIFTEEDINTMRAMCLDLDDQIDVKEQHKQAIVAEVKGEMKKLVAEKSDLRKKLRDGKIDKDMTLYAFDDQEAGVMEYYDQEGNFILSRPLLPTERQARLIGLKTGTDE